MSILQQIVLANKKAGFDAVLLAEPKNIRYVCNFTGEEAWLLVAEAGLALLTDGRFTNQAAKECKETAVLIKGSAGQSWQQLLQEQCRLWGINKLGLEADAFTCRQYSEIKQALPQVELGLIDETAEKGRLIKSSTELDKMRQAARIADAAWLDILPMLRPGVTEAEIANELEYAMRKKGAEGISFPSIVAAGENSALPHAHPGKKELKRGDFVVLDFGAIFEGYCSDITRTVIIGKATKEQKDFYELVLLAQKTALAAIKPGITGGGADAVARNVFKAAGKEIYFTHGLGHGVGLAVHEQPSLCPGDPAILTEGQVVTVEPGLYVAGWGGVRIEDTVLITSTGCERITMTPKDLLEL